MSGVLRTIGQVAGIAATISAVVTGPQSPLTVALTVVAVVANIGAQITAKKPPVQGSSSGITIGATMAALCIIGESYCGGARVKQVGYGTEDEVPNAWAWVVDVYSVAGPLQGLVSRQIEFSPVTFTGTAATGYYEDGLWSDYQLGETPEADALTPQEAGAPGWDASSKLSGKAAIGWSALWPKNGKMFGSGFPQTGAVWQGIKTWDPRDDDTYPGGSGTSRWADPVSDAAGHETAKATWTYNNNGGLQALRYALGSWERDETGSAAYIKVFGVGLKESQIVTEDFVELANVCDANGWTVNGVLREGQGISKWDNLKRILGACAAEPVWKGGRLGVRINAPRIALDTIELDDIAEGEPVVPGTRAYEERKNTLIPKFVDPASKWELVPSEAVSRSEYLTEDGEERSEEWSLDLVTNADQAAQVTGYELVNRREQGPITLPLKPRLRAYPPGTLLNVSAEVQAEFGIRESQLLVTGKVTDLERLNWQFNFSTETDDKHDFALGLTGDTPPPPYIPSGEVRDDSGSHVVGNPIAVVNSEAEMLALDVPYGTHAYRTDTKETWFYNGGTSGTITDWTLVSRSPEAGEPLTKTDDTNVTLTLGGTPATALLEATSLTLGWTGTLAVSRGGTGGGSASGTLLDNISGFGSTGHLVRTGSGAYDFRTVTGTANEITVTNGSGVSGNPTISLPTSLTFTGKTVTGGTFVSAVSLSTTNNITCGGFMRVNVATGGVGYGVGAGSTATQGAGSGKATTVAINRANGNITMNNAALGAGTAVTFAVTNSAVEANDNFVIQHISGGTVGAYVVSMAATSAGNAAITVTNITAGSLSEALVLKFSLIKGSIT